MNKECRGDIIQLPSRDESVHQPPSYPPNNPRPLAGCCRSSSSTTCPRGYGIQLSNRILNSMSIGRLVTYVGLAMVGCEVLSVF